jgi:hypothetical protein
MIKSFKTYLSEGLAPSSLPKADFIIRKYLRKKTALDLFRYPGVEEFTNSRGKGYGLRYFVPRKGYSLRFNWKQANLMGFANLSSVTFWNGHDPKPYVLDFKNDVSLVKVLPILVDIIKTGRVVDQEVYTLPDDVPLNENFSPGQSFLAEATFEMPEIYDGVLSLIQDPTFSKGKIFSLYKSAGFKIFDELERRYPTLIVKQGVKYVWAGKAKDLVKLQKDRASVLEAIGAVAASVSRGSSNESYKGNAAVDAIESDMERLTFEQQLEDLEKLLKLTISGASNAIFVAGKGGVGKTHTTEKILASMGMTDGSGYFKNTGSASAAGIYSLLFKYKNDVIFFDDSDDALGDTEARNIFKAATDTRKIRKLVWNKMGKNMVDPDDMSDDEILEAGLIPKYFEFTGKIIFISNLSLQKLDPDGALRTRAFVVNIDPTEMEIYDFMDKIVEKMPLEDGLSLDLKGRKHVVELLRKTTSKQAPNLRKLSRGLNMAAGAIAAGVNVSDEDLRRMIQTYA